MRSLRADGPSAARAARRRPAPASARASSSRRCRSARRGSRSTIEAVRLSRAWAFGDHLDTDQMVPGRYAPFMVGADKFHQYAFCDARPGFAKEVRPGDVLVGGENFGCGSSREYAPLALKTLGVGGIGPVRCPRSFFRHYVNLGIPAHVSR